MPPGGGATRPVGAFAKLTDSSAYLHDIRRAIANRSSIAFELSRRSTVSGKPVGRSLLSIHNKAPAANPHFPRTSRGLDAIRSELRGLGAGLVVVSNTGIWSFRPDDDIERFATSDRQVDEEV